MSPNTKREIHVHALEAKNGICAELKEFGFAQVPGVRYGPSRGRRQHFRLETNGPKSETNDAWDKALSAIQADDHFRGFMGAVTVSDVYRTSLSETPYRPCRSFPLPSLEMIELASGAFDACILRVQRAEDLPRDELDTLFLERGFQQAETTNGRVFTLAFQWFPDGRRAYQRVVDWFGEVGGVSQIELAITCRFYRQPDSCPVPLVVREGAFLQADAVG